MGSRSLPPSLSAALIPSLPPSIYYIPNFITPLEETHLLNHINTVPLPTWRTLSHRRLQAHPSPLSPSNTLLDAPLPTWLSEPTIPRLLSLRLEQHTGDDDGEGLFSKSPHGKPNHCLVNEYKVGEGIHAHEDGDAYYPAVCTVSLREHIVLNVTRKREDSGDAASHGFRGLGREKQREGETTEAGASSDEGERWRILQEPRSLLVTTGEAYRDCLHGIEGVEVDEALDVDGIANWDLLGDQEAYRDGRKKRDTRVSLTFRDVVKVKKVGKAFGGLFPK